MITNGLGVCGACRKSTEVQGILIDERKLPAGVEIIGRSIGDEIDDYFKPGRLQASGWFSCTASHVDAATISKVFRHHTD